MTNSVFMLIVVFVIAVLLTMTIGYELRNAELRRSSPFDRIPWYVSHEVAANTLLSLAVWIGFFFLVLR